MEFKRLFDLLEYQVKNFPKDDALACKINGTWKKFSSLDYATIADKLSTGLLKLGIKKDDKVAIVSPNRPEWNFVDIALQQIGAVGVPVYPTNTVENYNFIFRDADVKLIFVADQELHEKSKEAAVGITSVRDIYCFDSIDGVKNWSEIKTLGEEINAIELQNIKASIKSEDLVTLIYTSGTTGNPKGVMLTHANILSNVTECAPLLPVNYQHRALSFLPLSHVYERMLNYLYTRCGISIYYAENINTVAENLKEVQPHIFVTVPRLLEKVYDKIVEKGASLTGVKKKLFYWALNLGHQFENNVNQGIFYNFQLWLANKIIFNKWREALGGNIIVIISGGAALQPRLAKVFWAAQVKVMEGYGLTETSPVIAVNRPVEGDSMVGTVGLVLPNVEVKIAPDGEILTKGPHVMKGYYNKPDLTADVIDSEGWFHTGDIGEFIEGRFLKITDRKKEMFKTSGGKYIAPQVIENKFKESRIIEQIMVVGDGRKFASALIVPSIIGLKSWCSIKGIPFSDESTILNEPAVIEKFEKEVELYNESFAQFEKIKKFQLIKAPWTIESGELTPTLKLKRKVILENFKEVIERMYSEP
ncbi:long-chain-fatty-acid--CoA ligase [Sporocytophaga myxococcoides]|uniref:Long-chain-fatty-acid--CoA ligase n=1 Tax=Sporocytophaga myxococcoides TaxID=153721 RepID=A0A098LDD5_9BACT|nr:long-chain fatty acid--CoA ligase [Sporocytophaga myxococcoides]GAL84442.1 long-chain-fatty-acid--CoA ligase [Sporocytophaga myxococcoides]